MIWSNSGVGMTGWFQRLEKRRHELAQGADADLMQSNRRRFKLAFGLIGLAFALGLICSKLHLPATLKVVLVIAGGVAGITGLVLAKWAQHEHDFLTDPDPEGPPEIFRNKSD
jgi:hypothetical protein